MKEFDYNGRRLAEFQGSLFEKSYELNCSSAIFLRRFLYSDLLEKLDKNNSALLSLNVKEGINDIVMQFGETNYGKEKYDKNVLYWMGYLYRYISYTREESTKLVMKTINHCLLNSLYYSYHTQDPEWCVQSLLETNNLDEDFFDKNERLKRIIRESDYY